MDRTVVILEVKVAAGVAIHRVEKGFHWLENEGGLDLSTDLVLEKEIGLYDELRSHFVQLEVVGLKVDFVRFGRHHAVIVGVRKNIKQIDQRLVLGHQMVLELRIFVQINLQICVDVRNIEHRNVVIVKVQLKRGAVLFLVHKELQIANVLLDVCGRFEWNDRRFRLEFALDSLGKLVLFEEALFEFGEEKHGSMVVDRFYRELIMVSGFHEMNSN